MIHSMISYHNIADLLHLDNARIITITGAGGKTTLMEQLACSYLSKGKKILFTTTTHIIRPDSLPGFQPVISEDKKNIVRLLERGKSVCLGIPCGTAGGREKWQAPSPVFLQSLLSFPDIILCEGDGSKKLPVKIPRDHEPVFFPETDTVIGLIGLSCLGKPLGEIMFGFSEKMSVLKDAFPDINKNTLLDPSLLEFLVLSPHGLYKGCEGKNYHVVFNQADLLSKKNLDSIQELSSRLKSRNVSCHILSLKERYEVKDTEHS